MCFLIKGVDKICISSDVIVKYLPHYAIFVVLNSFCCTFYCTHWSSLEENVIFLTQNVVAHDTCVR
jgi:hypothetical protein